MLKKTLLFVSAVHVIGVSTAAQGPRRIASGDWPEQRGPSRDGVSRETGLIDQWAVNGQNFLWRVPGGGRSAPIVMGNRVYVQRPIGRGATLQEQIVALDADSGKVVWDHEMTLFQSDVPSHRVGLARRRSGNRQHLRAHRWRAGRRAEP